MSVLKLAAEFRLFANELMTVETNGNKDTRDPFTKTN